MSNADDRRYLNFLQRLSARYRENTNGKPVFTTNIDINKLWAQYLNAFENRQYHNCNTCKSFLHRYAGLVTIHPVTGIARSALWHPDDAPSDEERNALRLLRDYVETAKVEGVFYSDLGFLGEQAKGGWIHFAVQNPRVFSDPLQSAGQARAEKREEYKYIRKALRDYTTGQVAAALKLLKSGSLYRAEKVLDGMEWFAELQKKAMSENHLWVAVATAPAGFTRVTSRMGGTLLKDIAARMEADAIIARFNTKMDNYQRSEKPVSAGQVQAAEMAVEALGIAPAFERRYTQEFDILVEGAVLWQPSAVLPPILRVPNPASKPAGVFAGLAPGKAQPGDPAIDVPPRTMTWDKFQRDVLPKAAKIEYRVPQVGRFCALTTAMSLQAPPILQWDQPGARNPVAWSFPNPPATAEEWNLIPGALVPISVIVPTPNMWGQQPQPHHGQGVFLLIDGAKDVRGLPGGGLFVEHLRSDLKPYRQTVQAHLDRLTVADTGRTMAFGIGLMEGNDWTQTDAPRPVDLKLGVQGKPDTVHVMLVVDDSASMRAYISAARKAFRSLLKGVHDLPGKKIVSFIKFGNEVRVLADRVPLEELGEIESGMDGTSGNTALNDAIGLAIERSGTTIADACFMGIVTDGEENHSKRYRTADVRAAVQRVLATGKWTIAFAGAGNDPELYAKTIGVPEGNIASFGRSAEGFEDVGNRFAAGTRNLSAAYASGARSSTSFFSAVSGRKAIGKDHPVLLVTTMGGDQTAYKIDRWD